MDVLVTGATGFVGSHLCQRLREQDHRVTVLRRPSSDASTLSGLDLTHVVGDVTDPEAVSRAVRGREVVIHAAGHLDQSQRLASLQYAVNVEGTRNVVAACRASGVRRLVHLSSVAAVGIPRDRHRPADETFVFNLEQSGLHYPVSKKHAEDAVLHGVSQGLDAVIVNPSAICGPFRRGFRGGEVPAKVLRSTVVPYFLGGRNVVHVRDVVEGTLGALAHGRAGERYILGGENLTWREMSHIAAEILRCRRVFVPVPSLVTAAAAVLEPLGTLVGRRPRITYAVHYAASRFWFYDCSKATRELGYTARPYRGIVTEYLATRRAAGRTLNGRAATGRPAAERDADETT